MDPSFLPVIFLLLAFSTLTLPRNCYKYPPSSLYSSILHSLLSLSLSLEMQSAAASSSCSLSKQIAFLHLAVLSFFLLNNSASAGKDEAQDDSIMKYHNGPLLRGPTSVNLIWYGKFSPSQRAVVADFVSSLSSPEKISQPSVAAWWDTTRKYSRLSSPKATSPPLSLTLKSQSLDEAYSLGKTLKPRHLVRLASKGAEKNAVSIVLTSSDVAVAGFCSSRCGTHGSSRWGLQKGRFAFIWVGNSETQCPGQCAWPFHQPLYGPQSPPLVAPNGDVGMDGMVVNIASLLAGTATNPFGNGYYQGPADAPLEAASACTGIYGKGAYLGYPGELLVDSSTGGSYNAHGVNGRKYLLPAVFDPSTSKCSTLV